MTASGETAASWCADFYDDTFAEHHLVRHDAARLEAALDFLQDKLRLKPQARIFDQCCGLGSMSIPLAHRGYSVEAVDLIPSYIARARQEAAEVAHRCRFAVGDAHEYIAAAPCDAAINWWTSFGYSVSDAENSRMLACVAASLAPGGWFALDYMNAPRSLAEFAQGDTTHSAYRRPEGVTHWHSTYDRATRMIVKKWVYAPHEGPAIVKQGGGAKAYGAPELAGMLAACGFGDIEFYGSVAGEPLTDDSPRCIAVARRLP